MRWLLGAFGGLMLACLTTTAGLAAQSADPGSGTPPDTSEAELVFEREVFSYPSFARRNPFDPLTSGDESGPRFEDLTLMGVIYSTDPAASVALMGVPTAPAEGGSAIRTYRIRRGDRLGNSRILQIQRTRVVLEVEEFGLTERRTLEVKRPGQGGS